MKRDDRNVKLSDVSADLSSLCSETWTFIGELIFTLNTREHLIIVHVIPLAGCSRSHHHYGLVSFKRSVRGETKHRAAEIKYVAGCPGVHPGVFCSSRLCLFVTGLDAKHGGLSKIHLLFFPFFPFMRALDAVTTAACQVFLEFEASWLSHFPNVLLM